MRKFIQDSKLEAVQTLTARLEMAVEESPETLKCDGFTSRATMALGPTLELAARIVVPGGRAFLWKGSGLADEMRGAERTWRAAWRHAATVPFTNCPSVLAVFEKI